VEYAPTTTTVWSGEILRLKQSDFLFTIMSGPPLATFVKESRTRGYENKLCGPYESLLGQWDVLSKFVPIDYLDGLLATNYQPWWDDNCAFITELKQYTQSILSPEEFEAAQERTYRVTGWQWGMILVDAISRAADRVGIENIDGPSLRDALAETDMDADGFGNTWNVEMGVRNCFAYTVRLMDYSASEKRWASISDWYRPVALGG